jgi:hypothetical protein
MSSGMWVRKCRETAWRWCGMYGTSCRAVSIPVAGACALRGGLTPARGRRGKSAAGHECEGERSCRCDEGLRRFDHRGPSLLIASGTDRAVEMLQRTHIVPVGAINSVPLIRSSVLQGQSTGHVRIALRGAISRADGGKSADSRMAGICDHYSSGLHEPIDPKRLVVMRRPPEGVCRGGSSRELVRRREPRVVLSPIIPISSE